MARILLVDDDSDIRALGSALLSQMGHDVATASGAHEALGILDKRMIDVLITDANMPMASGFDLINTLRRQGTHSDLTICMLTGRRERKDIEKALALGAHDYIVKPIDPELFVKKVEGLLEKRPPRSGEAPEFATVRMNAPAKVRTAVEIVALSEYGVTLRSPVALLEGLQIDLDFEVFRQIGVEPPVMRVLSTREDKGTFEMRTAFIGAQERDLTKIRAWVHANTPRNRKTA